MNSYKKCSWHAKLADEFLKLEEEIDQKKRQNVAGSCQDEFMSAEDNELLLFTLQSYEEEINQKIECSSNMTFKKFRLLKTAIEEIFSRPREDLKVFAKEVARNCRIFIVDTKDHFWTFYNLLSFSERKYYEVLVAGVPCKLYLDIDIYRSVNDSYDYQYLVNEIIDIVNLDVKTNFDIVSTKDDVLILESNTSVKFSNHVIFQNIIFKDNKACLEYIESLENRLDLSRFNIDFQSKEKKIFDKNVYGRNQNFRILNSSKYGKNTVLKILYADTICKDSGIFFKSLISDKDLAINTGCVFNAGSANAHAKKVVPCLTDKIGNESKYPRIKEFICSLIGKDGEVDKESIYENSSTNKARKCFNLDTS